MKPLSFEEAKFILEGGLLFGIGLSIATHLVNILIKLWRDW
jgi:hypothetical protein